MYYITLTVGDETLILDHSHGYDIATIDGLTGVSSKLDTVQSNTDLGVAVQSGSVGGQKLVVRGYILDHNVAAKQALVSLLKPMARGTIVVYNLPTGTVGRLTPYRQTDFVVQATPKITQTKHAKFSFELLQPNPTWRAMEATRVMVPTDSLDPITVTIDGEAKADYDWLTYALAPIDSLIMQVIKPDSSRGLLAFYFSQIDPNGVTGNIRIWRKGGKLQATLNGYNILPYLQLSHYMLDGLTPGENSITATASLNGSLVSCVSSITYYPSYVGVVLRGI